MKWIKFKGLPECGYYLFKNSSTGEVKICKVSEYNGHKSYSIKKNSLDFIVTHYMKFLGENYRE